MAVTPAPPADAPPGDAPPGDANPAANPAAGRGAARRTPAAASSSDATEYAVYEATEVDKDGIPTTLQFVAKVTASNPKEARWSAADANKDVLARTKAKAEGDPPKLLPIAVRLAKPTATREKEKIETTRG